MKRYSKEELQQDFKLLKRCICEEHPLAFTDRNKVLAEFEQAEAGIRDGMTEEEFYYLVNPCAVSYTHLDVYKRQPCRKGDGNGSAFGQTVTASAH